MSEIVNFIKENVKEIVIIVVVVLFLLVLINKRCRFKRTKARIKIGGTSNGRDIFNRVR